MADNRMWLIHVPSKVGIKLGKRIGWGWYGAPKESELQRFYTYLMEDQVEDQDNFELFMESDSSNWRYTDKFVCGFRLFKSV